MASLYSWKQMQQDIDKALTLKFNKVTSIV
jgi:hypothetical protein